MKRYTKIGLSTLLIVTLLASAFMFIPEGSGEEEMTRASTLYVGSDQTYKTIKTAINAASGGDTIRIYDGVYNEPLTISKSLTFQGNGSSNTIVRQMTNEVTWWITAKSVTIKDIGFEANASFNNWAIKTDGYNTSGGSFITIQRCSFKDSHHGVAFALGSDNEVLDCTLYDSQIYFVYSNRNTVKNTSLYGGIIQLDSSNDNLVEDCRLTASAVDGRANIQVAGDSNLIMDCLIYDTQSNGIQIMGDSNIIIGNTLVNNAWEGIFLSGSDRNLISNNTISSSGDDGIRMIGVQNNTVRYNHISNCDQFGISLDRSSPPSSNNDIYCNNLISNNGNNKQAYEYHDLNNWNTSVGGNYWSDHSNTDTNNDFFADANYIIDGEGGARDRKPFASQLIFPNPPVITTTDITTANTNQIYSVQYEAFDWDTPSSGLTWTFNSNATWLTFTTSQELKGTPNVSTSTYWVDISVSDGQFTHTTNFTLSVVNSNVAPTILTVDVPVCFEDQLYEVDYEADDTDDLTWDLVTDAPFLSMDEETGVLSGTPTNDDVGTYTVSIVVIDEWSQDSTEFTLEVINTNDAPIITTDDVLSVQEGEFYSVQYSVEDIDEPGDILLWSMLTNCPFLHLDPETGYLSGTPGESDAGTYNVNISISDGNGGIDRHVFDLEVIKVNNAPSAVKDEWALTMEEDGSDTSMNLNSMFSDIDGDKLHFSVEDNSDIFADLSEDGTLTIDPAPDWTGTSTITVYATDGEFTVSSSIVIEVTNTNDPPYNPVIDTGSVDFKENETQTVTASAIDIDQDETLSYEWSVEGIGVIGSGETIDLDLPAGNYTLILKVTDSSGSFTTTTMQIEVLPKDTMVPHTGDPSKKTSLIPYIVGAALLLLLAAFILSFFAIRKRNKRQETNREGIKAWNQTLSFENSPTPAKGMVPGSGTATQAHRFVPDLDHADAGRSVNGGKLGPVDPEEIMEEKAEADKGTTYLSDLMEEVLLAKEGQPPTTSLVDKLERAHEDGEIPTGEYREIKRRLNNIDK